jgi:hypothetical protein
MAEKGEVRHAETTPLRAREFRSQGLTQPKTGFTPVSLSFAIICRF